jgi:hypothetical protein
MFSSNALDHMELEPSNSSKAVVVVVMSLEMAGVIVTILDLMYRSRGGCFSPSYGIVYSRVLGCLL